MMNFNSNALLTSRIQQQQQSSIPQQSSHIQQNQSVNSVNIHQKAANMSNQPSPFPPISTTQPQQQQQQPSSANAGLPGMTKANDDKLPPNVHQQQPQQPIHNNNNNNNNNNSHNAQRALLLIQQQQHQQNMNPNMNVSSHQSINKNLHQMTSPQQHQQQNTFHQQQTMSSVSKIESGGIIHQMNQFVRQNIMSGGPMSSQQHSMQHISSSTQKFQSTSILPPSLLQSKPLMPSPSSHQVQQQQMRQNYGNSPPPVSTSSSNPHPQMQYSPTKPIHPQMKTTAKLASPGSQLQNLQQQLTSLVSSIHPLTPSPSIAASAPTSTSTSSSSSSSVAAAGNNNNSNNNISNISTNPSAVVASAKLISSPTPPSSTSNNSVPLTPSTPATKPNIEKSPEIAKAQIVNQSNKPAVAPANVEEKKVTPEKPANVSTQKSPALPIVDESKVEENKVLIDEKKTTPEKSSPQKSPATSTAAAQITKSTMRLATVTPPRKKPPPTITKKVASQSNKKTVESPIKSVPAKSENVVEKPAIVKNSSDVPKTPTTKKEKQEKEKVTNFTPKTKRVRTKVQPYQSPTPELALVTKLSTQIANSSSSSSKSGDDNKLTIFYKNEFLAVRNGEGTFYLCQAMHNVYKSSPKIKIRWLNEKVEGKLNESGARTYNVDFYDLTDIECVLTTVELDKVDSKTYELPKEERERIESILKKAIDVEKGVVPRPSVTENNPDGLDLSIYKDEAQLDKISSARKRTSKKSSDEDYSDNEPVKKKKKEVGTPKKSLTPRASTKKPAIVDAESSESDEENLMEIKKKAANIKKPSDPVPSTSKEALKTQARGRKRAAPTETPAVMEKNAKVLKTEKKAEEVSKPNVTATPKVTSKAKVFKKNDVTSKKEPIKEKKPALVEKKKEPTTPLKAENEKAQITSPAANKKVNKNSSPAKIAAPAEPSSSTPTSGKVNPRARNTRSKK